MENTEQTNVEVTTPVEELVEIEIQEEAPAEVAQEEKKPFDPKTDKVDFNTPEQQEKFNYVYKQVKMSDQRNSMLTEQNAMLLKRLEEVEERFNKTDAADAESVLLTKIKQARDAGDDAAELNATNALIEFKVSKVTQKAPEAPVNTYQPEFSYISNVVQERDDSGNLVRPWFNETHPEFNNTIETLRGIAAKYVGDPQAVPKSLQELDHIMRAKMNKPPVQNRAPNPMQGGNLTNVNPKPTIKLTRQELDIAKKLGVDPKRYAAKRDEMRGKKS